MKDDLGRFIILDIEIANLFRRTSVDIYGPNTDGPDLFEGMFDKSNNSFQNNKENWVGD